MAKPGRPETRGTPCMASLNEDQPAHHPPQHMKRHPRPRAGAEGPATAKVSALHGSHEFSHDAGRIHNLAGFYR